MVKDIGCNEWHAMREYLVGDWTAETDNARKVFHHENKTNQWYY